MREVRFDDIEGLRAEIRTELGPWGAPRRITQEMIDAFAELTCDHQWIHSDVERARRESPFGGTIAHGFLILSHIASLPSGSDLAIVGYGSAINYGADKLRFVSPVPAGAEIRARRRIHDVARKGAGTLATFESEVGVVGADRPAISYLHLALYLP